MGVGIKVGVGVLVGAGVWVGIVVLVGWIVGVTVGNWVGLLQDEMIKAKRTRHGLIFILPQQMFNY